MYPDSVDSFLKSNEKKHLFDPQGGGVMDRFIGLILNITFLFIPYFLFGARNYHPFVYSREGKNSLARRQGRIDRLLEEAHVDLDSNEEVQFAVLTDTVGFPNGLVFTNRRCVYQLWASKKSLDLSKPVTGSFELSEMGRPLLSKKSLAENVSIKFGDEVIGALNEVRRPQFIEDFLIEIYQSLDAKRSP